MNKQTIENKKGEVDFRKELYSQFSGKKSSCTGQPTKQEYIQLLKERIKISKKTFRSLKKIDVIFTPFLELGAERGQRSLTLIKEFEAQGIASDISFESLLSTNIVQKDFHFKKLPIRVVLDCYNLPFIANSIPFIFCYQTLHHFPDPKPILSEVNRVLQPGGFFYFDEEPIKQKINLNLFRRDFHLRWWEKILKLFFILPFISTIGRSETEKGILEETFDLTTWKNALNIFDKVDVVVKTYPFNIIAKRKKRENKNWITPPLFANLLLSLTGGGIEALCQKRGEVIKNKDFSWDIFACPDCKTKPQLHFSSETKNLLCKQCKRKFEPFGNIYFLLNRNVQRILYPNQRISYDS